VFKRDGDRAFVAHNYFCRLIDISLSRIWLMNRPPLDCPIKTTLWQQYRQRNPNGLAVPPIGAEDNEHPDIAEYCDHIATCVECNLV
jgi:hypothetical protein